MAAASPFSGSIGFGYVRSCGKKDSKILDKSADEKRQCLIIHKDLSTFNAKYHIKLSKLG
jgi:hypothetical protein